MLDRTNARRAQDASNAPPQDECFQRDVTAEVVARLSSPQAIEFRRQAMEDHRRDLHRRDFHRRDLAERFAATMDDTAAVPAEPRPQRNRRPTLTQAEIKRAIKAGGKIVLPYGTVITAADQTNTGAEVNVFDIEAEKLRRLKRGDG
jgi:hypothetical protein